MGNLDGTAIKAIDLPSYTVLDVRGTIRIEDGETFANYVPLRCLGQHDIDIPNVGIFGNPRYSIWVQSCTDFHMGYVEIVHTLPIQIGLGVRIDSARGPRSKNVSLDYLYAEKTGSHGLETVAVDGLRVGTVRAVNTWEAGALIQGLGSAEIGLVDATNASRGWAAEGHTKNHAALRFANDAGPGIHVEKVIARKGARGIFCVSQSWGITIDEVDIAETEGESILIENCYDVNIASKRGTVSGKEVRVASRGEFPPSTKVTLQNLTLNNSQSRNTVCDGKIIVQNNVLNASQLLLCPGDDADGNVVR